MYDLHPLEFAVFMKRYGPACGIGVTGIVSFYRELFPFFVAALNVSKGVYQYCGPYHDNAARLDQCQAGMRDINATASTHFGVLCDLQVRRRQQALACSAHGSCDRPA